MKKKLNAAKAALALAAGAALLGLRSEAHAASKKVAWQDSNTVNFGRVLLGTQPTAGAKGMTLSGSGNPASWSLSTGGNAGISVSATSGSNAQTITFNLANNASGYAASGTKSYTLTLSGDVASPSAFNVTATVLQNRDLSQSGSAIDLGRVMVGQNTGSFNATITGGSLDDNNATRVWLNNGNVSGSGVTVTRSGGNLLFNSANQTATVGLMGNFASSGAKSGSVNIASLLSNGETAISGTPAVDSALNVAYTATAVGKRTVTASPINLGRFISSQSVVGASTLSTTGADSDFTRVTVNGTQFNSAASTGTYTLAAKTYAAGSVSGSVNLGVTGEGLSNEGVYGDVVVNYSGTSVVQRSVANGTLQAGTVHVGRVLLNSSTTVSLSTPDTVAADGTHSTWLDLAASGTSISSNGITIASSSSNVQTFNNRNQTYNLTVTFTQTGLQGLRNVDVGALLGKSASETAGGAGGAGSVIIPITANVGLADVGSNNSFGDALSATIDNIHRNLVGLGSKTTAGSGDSLGSEATIRYGVSTQNGIANMAWRARNAVTETSIFSDVVDWTMPHNGDTYVLQLSYNEADLGRVNESKLTLGWYDPNQSKWVKAGTGNSLGAYSGQTTAGNWGVDTSTNTVWAVLNHNSDFGVLSGQVPASISLSNTADNTNLATGGAVNITGSAGHYISEIDDLDTNAAVGTAHLSQSPSAPVFAMLWLTDTTGIGDLVTDLKQSAGVLNVWSADPGTGSEWSKLAGHYSGFGMLVEFDSGITGSNLNWDFGTGNTYDTIQVDKVAVVPEPGSMSLLGLGLLGALGRRRRSGKSRKNDPWLDRYFGRARNA